MTHFETKTDVGTYGQTFEYETVKSTVGGLLVAVRNDQESLWEDLGDCTGDDYRYLATLADIEEVIRKTYRSLHPTFESMTPDSWETYQQTSLEDARLVAFMGEAGLVDDVREVLGSYDESVRDDARIDSDNEVELPNG